MVRQRWRRLVWFVLIWGASVLSMMAIAGAIRLLIVN
ncbi:DUF2474 family protein [Tropicibacter sp. Alg240-R139]